MSPEDFKKARNALGLTLSEAAQQLGVPRAHVERMERARCSAIPRPLAIIMQHYLDGHRPRDWPEKPASPRRRDVSRFSEV